MTLAQCYIEYLRDRRDPVPRDRLCQQLEAQGFATEARLLRHDGLEPHATLEHGPWAGRRVYLGEQLPLKAQAGELWFDTCELGLMVLVPRPPFDEPVPEAIMQLMTPFVGWLSIRPVAVWQYAAFLKLASFVPVRQQLAPKIKFLDGTRLFADAERAAITRLTPGEARLYSNWIGKGVADQGIRQAAHRALPSGLMETLWSPSGREWAGDSAIEEGTYIVISPETLHRDEQEEEEDEDRATAPRLPMRYGEWSMPDGVAFRTSVSTQLGLITELGDVSFSSDPVRVAAPLERHT